MALTQKTIISRSVDSKEAVAEITVLNGQALNNFSNIANSSQEIVETSKQIAAQLKESAAAVEDSFNTGIYCNSQSIIKAGSRT